MTAEPTAGGDTRRRLEEALRARRAAPGPLAPNQERLHVLQQLDPTSTAYVETVVLHLRGPLDVDALAAALTALPGRHEWLRSRIEAGPDGPVQVVDDALEPDVRTVDLADVPAGVPGPAEPAAGTAGGPLPPAAMAWLDDLVHEPLDLGRGPVWRAGVAVLAPDEHVLALVVHHVACDATSLGVLVEEIGDRYDAAVTGEPVELPRVPSPRDVARSLRALQRSPAALSAVERHADALAAADGPVADLTDAGSADGSPPLRERAAARRAGAVVRSVPTAVSRRVRRVAAQHDVTPFALVSTAVAAAVADAVDVDTPVLGIPVDLRWHVPGSEDVVSFLVETVAVAVPDLRRRTLPEAAAAVRDAVADGLATPPRFDEVVAALRSRRPSATTGSPVQAYLTWLEADEHTTLGEHGPVVTHVDVPLTDPKETLAWTVVQRGRDLTLRLEHDTGHLDHARAAALVDRALRVLDLATDAPATELGQVELVGDEELRRLREWEGRPGPPPTSDLLSTVVAGLRRSDGPVLLTDAGSLTADELLDGVERLAGVLRAAGVRRGVRVAVSSHRVPAMVTAVLAVLRAGGTFVPLDPGHPRDRQVRLARAARVGVVVGDPGWATALATAAGAAPVAVHPGGEAVDAGAATLDAGAPAGPPTPAGPAVPARPAVPADDLPAGRRPTDLAYVMFTSGSTGDPKAVRVTDGAIVARLDSDRHVLADGGVRFLLQSPLTFDASMYLFWALATGGSLVLPRDTQAGDPTELIGLVERHGVTDACFVPALYEAVLEVADPVALRSLRRVCLGGEVLPPAVAAMHHDSLPAVRLYNVYGPTEVVNTATAALVQVADVAAGGPLPIGRPHPGTVARVLDRFGRRVPVGAVGELHLGGPSVADGYEPTADQDPGADDGTPAAGPTAGPFLVRSEPDGDGPVRWYATGDLVRWRPDGRLEYVGRRDRQVKLRGQRVELGEIEAALRRAPGVADAVVELVGAGAARRLVGFVAPDVLVPPVQEHLAATLPEAWLPDVVLAVPQLPRTSSGKLDRAALRAGVPGPSPATRGTPAAEAAAPTLFERTVLSVVQGLLGDLGIGLDDDFFAVGGNSLLAARLMGQLHVVLGATVPLHELAGSPTIRGISALLEAAAGRQATTPQDVARLVPVRRAGSLPPVVLVAREGATSLVLQHVLTRLEPDRPVWTVLRAMPELDLGRRPDFVADGEEVARMLTAAFPRGPVNLVGHSASGLVALEVARALGDRHGVTVLLDTLPPPTWAHPLRLLDEGARLLVQRGRVRRWVRRAAPDALAPGVVRSVRNHQDATAAFLARPRPVGFPVTVLTSDEAREARGRADLGWGRWAADVRTVPLRGGHHDQLLQPDVVETARIVVDVLRA